MDKTGGNASGKPDRVCAGADKREALSDEALCALARGGDAEAETLLVSRYARLASSLARQYFLAGGTQEDLRQEGMIGLLSAVREYTPGRSSFKTFAGLCIRRNIIDAIRRSQNHNNLFYNEVLSLSQIDPDESQVYPTEQDPEQQVIGKDDRKRIEQELKSKLSNFEQQVLSLYFDGFSYAEIAEKLGKSVKSVDNAVQRIRRKLSS